MKKKIIVISLLIVVLLVGGIFTWKITQNKEQKTDSPNQQRDNDTPPPSDNPNGKLSQTELEKYLLEKRLDLQKYFVFNLGELTEEEFNFKNEKGQETEVRGIKKTNSLVQHLTNLTGSTKGFVFLDKRNGPEWKGKKLNQKIKEGKTYIVFDKNFPENGEPHFGGIPISNKETNETYFLIFALDLLSPKVSIFQNEKETLDFLTKNDPVFR